MNPNPRESATPDVSPIHVSKNSFLDPKLVGIEAQRLWTRVWQVACRLEEIPEVGRFVTYDVANESLIVMRTAPDTIKAFHNTCRHRGMRLLANTGQCKQIICPFHGWRWNLDGTNSLVVDRKDWGNTLSEEDLHLREALVDTWGGFVFINMDLNAEPLHKFLSPINERCRNYEFEKLRFRWYRTVVLPCNWKLALEAFDEGYHVQQTHRQVLNWVEDYSNSGAFGRHSAFWYPTDVDAPHQMTGSKRLNRDPLPDAREYILGFVEHFHNELAAMVTPRAYEATQRLRTEVSPDASPPEVLMKWAQFQQEAAIADGAGWPPVTLDDIKNSFVDWHMFPNTIFLHSSIDGVLWYRSRPNGDDPESCIFDIWSLVRYAPGAEPPLVRERYQSWRDCKWGQILTQDFVNLERMQKGMKSMSFQHLRPNPVQEMAIANFHRALEEYMAEPADEERPAVRRKSASGARSPLGVAK
jgi:phenylpropionate dioxygenase-like ring-hydroxylating dioxygenase large terminal subunit